MRQRRAAGGKQRAACEQRFGEDKVGVWLAGHNALVYDMRVLWGNLTRLEIEPVAELAELGVRGVLDTLKLARAREWGAAPPTLNASDGEAGGAVSFSNGALFKRLTGETLGVSGGMGIGG